MDNPRPEKVAVVDEVRERLEGSQAAILTEYRGITVSDISTLRRSLRAAGGDYKVYKNTLVRFAARDLGLEIDEMLTGPTAIAFVPKDSAGDPVLVAKALKDFAKGNQFLVVKGGVLGTKTLSAKDASALADVAPREELLARFAGALQAPMANLASLLQAPLQNLAGLLKALLEEQGGEVLPADAPTDGDADTTEAPAPEAAADTTEAPAPEAAADTNEPDTEAADAADAGTEPADPASEGS
jgi:large subunit ribosomal protein L10